MFKRGWIAVAVMTALLTVFGCNNKTEAGDPDVGVEKQDLLTIKTDDSGNITIFWTVAPAGNTSLLLYRLYASDFPQTDPELMDINATPITDWSEDPGNAEVSVSELETAETTYFYLIMKDIAGIKSIYSETAYCVLSYEASGEAYMVKTVPSAGLEKVYVDLDLTSWYAGSSEAPKVYYLFTNAGSEGLDRPSLVDISSNAITASSVSSKGLLDSSSTGGSSVERVTPTASLPIALRGLPDTEESYVSRDVSIARDGETSTEEWPASGDYVGKKEDLFNISPYNITDETGNVLETVSSIAATCRSVVAAHGVTLNIWVADDCWEDSTEKTFLMNETMATALANAFLSVGEDDDIYEWISGIFGEEWGTDHLKTGYIGDNNEITILLYDIDGDGGGSNAPYDTEVGAYTAGFFWSRDNGLSSTSNQRIMFYIDAPVFACADDPVTPKTEGRWDVTNYYPSGQISTLAHEFQHMIHYYQKSVKQNSGSTDTWLNEMCSMVAEDLVADKMGVNGPRGMDFTNSDYSGGASEDAAVTDGRIPLFNYYADGSLTSWDSSTESWMVLADYALSYSFGAYLARNYGGAKLFRHIVQNPLTNEEAVTGAIATLIENTEEAPDFEDLLAGWGAAVLLSNEIRSNEVRMFNSGAEGFISTADLPDDPIQYTLGGINFYRFAYDEGTIDQQGPYIYGTSSDPDYYGSTLNNTYEKHEPASNIYYKDIILDRTMKREFTLGPGVRLTIIIKE